MENIKSFKDKLLRQRNIHLSSESNYSHYLLIIDRNSIKLLLNDFKIKPYNCNKLINSQSKC